MPRPVLLLALALLLVAVPSVGAINAATAGANCTLQFPPITPGTIRGNTTQRTVYLQARDQYGAPVTSGGDLFVASLYPTYPTCSPNISYPHCAVTCAPYHSPLTPSPACLSSAITGTGTATPHYVVANVTDWNNGVYSISYSPEVPNTYTLRVHQLVQGGLNGQYYDNVWFLNTPVIQRIDSQINFNWGSGVITQYATDYVSVRWTGALVAPVSETFTIYGLADDWIRVWIDKRLIFEAWGAGCCNETWGTVSLTANFKHDIIVDYAELRGNASISLSWRSFSTPKSLIPSMAFYSRIALQSSPFTNIVLGPGDPPSALTSYAFDNSSALVPTGGLSSAVAGVSTGVMLQAVDVFGNRQVNASNYLAQLTVTLNGNDASPTISTVYRNSGQYLINYTAAITGSYLLNINISGAPIQGSPFRVSIVPASTSPPLTFVYGLSATTQAGSTSYSYAQLRDTLANNRTSAGGETVYVSWNNLDTGLSYQALVIYYGPGLYQSYFTPSIAGSYGVTFYVNAVSVGASPYAVSVTPGPVLAATSTPLGAALTTAVAGVSQPFSVRARDQFGNVVSGGGLTFTYTIINTVNGLTASSGSLVYSTNGYYNASYTLSTAGAYTLSVLGAGSLPVLGSPFILVVVPGTASAVRCTVIGTAPSAAFSGQTLAWQVQGRDSSSNAVITGGLTFAVSLVCGGVTVTGTSVDLGTGAYSLSVTPTRSSSACTLTVQSGGVNIVGSPFTIAVSPGAAYGSNTVAGGSLTSGTAGVLSTVTVTSYDASNNALTIGGSLVSVTLSPTVAVTRSDYGTGAYGFTYTPTVAGTYTTTVSVLVQGALVGQYYSDQYFTTLYTTRTDSAVNFNWLASAPASGMSVGYYSVLWTGQVRAPLTGAYTFYLATNADTGVQLTVNGITVISALSALAGSTLRFGSITLTAAQHYPLTLKLTALGSGASIALSWSCAAFFVQKLVDSSALYYSTSVTGSPFTTAIGPSASVASTSSYSVSGVTGSTLIAAQSFTITVQLRDIYSNTQTLTSEAASISIALVTSGGTNTGTATSTGSGGQYSVTVTPTHLGAATLTVRLSGTVIATSQSYTVTAGPVAPAHCLVTTSITPVYAGATSSFTIQVADTLNNYLDYDVTSASVVFTVTMTSSSPSATINPVLSYVSNGQYSLAYTPLMAAVYTLTIRLSGTNIVGSPFTVTVAPTQASPTTTHLVGSPSNLVLNVLSPLATVQTVDSLGNALSSGGYQFVISLADKATMTTRFIRGISVDNSDGTYTIQALGTVADEYLGDIQLVAGTGVGNSGAGSGLTGSYYNNRWLTGSPVLTRVDPLINFDYGSDASPVAITPTARNYVSVSWAGYLRIDTANNYTFTVKYADGIKLTINGAVLIDNFLGTAGVIATWYIFPQSSTLYSIQLQYRHNTDVAYVQLSWTCTALGIANQIVPTSVLYPQATSILASPIDIFVA